jgi:hypothetical protein
VSPEREAQKGYWSATPWAKGSASRGQWGGGRGPAGAPPPPLLLSYLAKPRALVPLIPLYIVDRWRQENTQLIIEIYLCFPSPRGSFKSYVEREKTLPSTRERCWDPDPEDLVLQLY